MRQHLIDFCAWRAERCLKRHDFWIGLARWLNGTSQIHGGSNGKR